MARNFLETDGVLNWGMIFPVPFFGQRLYSNVKRTKATFEWNTLRLPHYYGHFFFGHWQKKPYNHIFLVNKPVFSLSGSNQ